MKQKLWKKIVSGATAMVIAACMLPAQAAFAATVVGEELGGLSDAPDAATLNLEAIDTNMTGVETIGRFVIDHDEKQITVNNAYPITIKGDGTAGGWGVYTSWVTDITLDSTLRMNATGISKFDGSGIPALSVISNSGARVTGQGSNITLSSANGYAVVANTSDTDASLTIDGEIGDITANAPSGYYVPGIYSYSGDIEIAGKISYIDGLDCDGGNLTISGTVDTIAYVGSGISMAGSQEGLVISGTVGEIPGSISYIGPITISGTIGDIRGITATGGYSVVVEDSGKIGDVGSIVGANVNILGTIGNVGNINANDGNLTISGTVGDISNGLSASSTPGEPTATVTISNTANIGIITGSTGIRAAAINIDSPVTVIGTSSEGAMYYEQPTIGIPSYTATWSIDPSGTPVAGSSSSYVWDKSHKYVKIVDNSAPTLAGTATISNTAPKVGDTLTGSLVNDNHLGTLSYTWKNGEEILGTGVSYTVQKADLGKVITLAIASSAQNGTLTSAPTSAVAPAADATVPTVTAVEPSGTTVSTSPGSLSITFSEAMDNTTIGTVSLSSNVAIKANGAWESGNTVYTTTYAALAPATTYTMDISGFKSAQGVTMLDNIHTFTTAGGTTDPTTYEVTFDLNGGIRTGGGELEQTVLSGGAAIEPTVARSGYDFIGWDKPFDNTTDNLTVTAQWSPVVEPEPTTEYTVTFNLNGGTQTDSVALTQKVLSGGAATAPEVTRSGYTFTGWDKAFDNVIEDITVTARWSQNSSDGGDNGGGDNGGGGSTPSGGGGSGSNSPTATPTPAPIVVLPVDESSKVMQDALATPEVAPVITLDDNTAAVDLSGADLLANAANGNDVSVVKDDWTLAVSPELVSSLNVAEDSALRVTFTAQETAVNAATAATLTAIDPINAQLSKTVYNVALSVDGRTVSKTEQPVKISIDVAALNLTDAQKANFTGIVYDANLQAYKQLGGEFSADGTTFTFYSQDAGDYSAIVSDKLTKIKLTVGDSNYSVNGETSANDVAPVITNDNRTLVPVRVIAESLGADVAWDGTTKTVTITKDGATVELIIGQTLPGGMGAAEIMDERTFVPVRYVSEALGANVVWDNAAKQINIYE